MFEIILLIGIYIAGIIICRDCIARYQKWYSGYDVFTCFMPIGHWIVICILLADAYNIGDKIIDRFFKKRD